MLITNWPEMASVDDNDYHKKCKKPFKIKPPRNYN